MAASAACRRALLTFVLLLGPAILGAQSAGPSVSALQDSLSKLDEAVYRAPKSAAAWYQLALLKLELDRRGAAVKASMHQGDGESWRHGAFTALARSLAADSTYSPAAGTLASLVIASDQSELEPAVQRAVRVATTTRSGRDAWLALARMQRTLGHPDSIIPALVRYERAGGDSGIADLEAARALSALGHPDSAVARYEAGAAHTDSASRRLYRADIGWVATPAELASFDSTSAAGLGEWIRNFWRRRDVTALRPEGERLAEQLRRWNYVRDHFRIVGRAEGTQFSDGPGANAPSADPALTEATDVGNNLGALGALAPDAYSLVEGGRRILDDRGVVYMRHGEPDNRVSWPSGSLGNNEHGCVVANESWQYVLPTGNLLVHFCASRRLGSTAATTLVPMLPLYHDLVESRGALDPRYAYLAAQLQDLALRSKLSKQGAQLNAMGAAGGDSYNSSLTDLGLLVRPEDAAAMQESGRRQLTTALHTDTYVQRYESSLKPVVQLYAVGEPGPSARLLIVFAIPGDRLKAETRPGVTGVIYPLSIRTIAVGPTGLDVLRRDTTRFFRVADTLKAGSWLNGLLELPLPTGQHDVRVLFTQPDGPAAAAAGRDAMTAGAPGRLALSDLVSGRQGAGLVWAHGGDPVPLNPLDTYSRASAMELYYDLTGLVPGKSYRTTIELANTLAISRGDAVRVSFDDKATAPAQHVRRSLDLKTLKGGQYRLVLTVEDVATGTKVSRERTVNVRE
jgi:hypothetical protein